ncbi:hypothetical protein ACFYW8_01575 [Streptomyces sp. NPDC002742]|jgi:hypothetical protein|uniref:hypothetical protein n=1 Tax=unclassified Streptomyces TaxID=2593676 RepID=UPI003448F511
MTEHPNPAGAHSADDDYSATVLSSHWIQRPDHPDTLPLSGDTATMALSGATAATVALPDSTTGETHPDRVEGTLLRFGPGVNADTMRRVTAVPAAVPVRRRTWRRHALPTVVLLAVVAFLLWHRSAPSLAVDAVAVSAASSSPGCDETADITGTVTTNGRSGDLAYRWVRSDGTSSDVLHEDMTRGQKQARLHLLWTFQGNGRYEARAELRLLSPVRRTVSTELTYNCP